MFNLEKAVAIQKIPRDSAAHGSEAKGFLSAYMSLSLKCGRSASTYMYFAGQSIPHISPLQLFM